MMSYSRRHGKRVLPVVFLLSFAFTALAEEVAIFGPHRFEKPRGAPVTIQETFTAPSGIKDCLLTLSTGEAGERESKNVHLRLNGAEVLASADLRGVNPSTATVTLLPQNTLEVTLKGQGDTFVTAAVSCRQEASIVVLSPPDGSTVGERVFTLRGTVRGLENPGVRIGMLPALSEGEEFAFNQLSTSGLSGPKEIPIEALDSSGRKVQATLHLTFEPSWAGVELKPDKTRGPSPLEVLFETESFLGTDNPLVSSALSCSGPGRALVEQSSPGSFRATLEGIGLFDCTLRATDSRGASHTDTLSIALYDSAELDVHLQEHWKGMQEAMVTGDIEKTVSFFSVDSQDRYRQIFTALGEKLPGVAAAMREIELVEMAEGGALYRIKKPEIHGGRNYEVSYEIFFVQDIDGLWKIFQL